MAALDHGAVKPVTREVHTLSDIHSHLANELDILDSRIRAIKDSVINRLTSIRAIATLHHAPRSTEVHIVLAVDVDDPAVTGRAPRKRVAVKKYGDVTVANVERGAASLSDVRVEEVRAG